MLPSYRARLRRDLLDWQERGLIDAAQRERIAAEALAPPGPGYLQGILVLCIVVLVAPAIIAFVAANWSGLAPATRMVVLFSADAAAVLGAWFAGRRHARAPSAPQRAVADGAATLSLVLAAATLALVGQTFHVPPDLRGYAATVAALGLATALVARSGGAAFAACAALVVADVGPWDGGAAPGAGSPTFWFVASGLLAGFLTGWLPARAPSLTVLLVVLANHLGAASGGIPTIGPDRLMLVAALALGAGHALAGQALAGFGADPRTARLREGGAALAQAATGVCLLGILAVAARTLGWGGRPSPAWILPTLLAFAAAGALLVLPRRRGRGPLPLPELIVLGSTALSFLVLLTGAWGWAPARGGSPFWTVWGGIVPALGLVVAGHLDERRALFGWGLALVAGLIVGMLAVSRDLLGFSVNLLGSAALVALTLALCRWADRRLAGRTA
ncbi:DUF2157 domain-containing protein [uncultured Methylobacterium sp.]|uniref:DUF2157 domain-containing protein n=1 Tax=uncultured Methylobacterium sp. TaxID=157278 RepID=UPI0035CA2BE1